MVIEVKTLIMILLIHFLGDFALQTHEQSTKKSTSGKFLFYHVGVYSFVWFIAAYGIYDDWNKAGLFAIITFWAHFIVDYATSRIGKPFWDKGDHHNGFVVVGADQVIHYIQLIYTYIIILELNQL
jgi:membrane-bound metal-dependent hydrolase YbcI (DUF457 family)